MDEVGNGVKAVVRKDDRFLVLVKPDGSFYLPGGRVETGETNKSALHREIDGGGPNCLDNLSIELNSELCILRTRPQAASANG